MKLVSPYIESPSIKWPVFWRHVRFLQYAKRCMGLHIGWSTCLEYKKHEGLTSGFFFCFWFFLGGGVIVFFWLHSLTKFGVSKDSQFFLRYKHPCMRSISESPATIVSIIYVLNRPVYRNKRKGTVLK